MALAAGQLDTVECASAGGECAGRNEKCPRRPVSGRQTVMVGRGLGANPAVGAPRRLTINPGSASFAVPRGSVDHLNRFRENDGAHFSSRRSLNRYVKSGSGSDNRIRYEFEFSEETELRQGWRSRTPRPLRRRVLLKQTSKPLSENHDDVHREFLRRCGQALFVLGAQGCPDSPLHLASLSKSKDDELTDSLTPPQTCLRQTPRRHAAGRRPRSATCAPTPLAPRVYASCATAVHSIASPPANSASPPAPLPP